MEKKYLCILHFEYNKENLQPFFVSGLKALGFFPKLMSIYFNLNEMLEDVSFDEDVLL